MCASGRAKACRRTISPRPQRPCRSVIRKSSVSAQRPSYRWDKLLPPDVREAPTGVFFKTMDELNIAQFRSDGFTFNRLPPYTSWQEVFPEAMRLWQEYCRMAAPIRVVRVAARYINRLRFAMPVELSAFLSASPVVPEPLPQLLRGYLTRIVLTDPQTTNSVVVTQALERSAEPDHVVLLLDVDAYRDVDLEAEDDTIAAIFASLHDLKNRVFFGSITERAAEMYE